MAESAPDSRRVVLAALSACRRGSNLPEALAAAGLSTLAPRDRAFARRLAMHALRHRRRLEARAAACLERPGRDPTVSNLLWLGSAQLEHPDIADHAAIHSTVELAPRRLRGLVNAVLRRLQREAAPPPATPAERYSFPDWLADQLEADWGECSAAMLAALNEEPPLVLRVNRRRITRADYAARLAAAGIAARPLGEDGLRLDRSLPLEDLPGFADGLVSVQGAAAQYAADLLPLEPGLEVLDACAAPGGKSAHLLEREPGIALTALDVDAARVARLEATLSRLGLAAEVAVADASRPGPAAAYDRILLDAPCSGTGVIGRHPDIKWLRRAADIPALSARQKSLLAALWPQLKADGVLLYCSCSLLTAENDAVISDFLAGQCDAVVEPLSLSAGEASAYGWRLPPDGDHEGFYYARLRKAATGRGPERRG